MLDHRFDVALHADVGAHEARAPAGILDERDGLAASRVVDVRDHDRGALRANASADARPMPIAAPVTTAIFPSSDPICGSP